MSTAIEMRDGTLWDIRDKGPVMVPKPLSNSYPAYQAAVAAMTPFLQARFKRATETVQIVRAISEHGRRLGLV
jgi:hypothetical protein